MSVVAAVLVVAAMLAGRRPAPLQRFQRVEPEAEVGAPRIRLRRFGWPAAVAVPCLTGWGIAGGKGASLGFCVGAVAVTTWSVWRDHRTRSRARLVAEQVVSGCQALAGLLRVGHVPAVALRLAAAESPMLAEAAAVQQVGGQVPAALRRLGARPGAAGLVELAIAWEVSSLTGASLTGALDALDDRLDASRKLRRVVDAELAAPRATSRMLAALPLAGLGLGFAFGGDPVAFLLGTPLGQAALCAGVGLACGGVLWAERIARAAGG